MIPDNPARVAPPDDPRPEREQDCEPTEADMQRMFGSGKVAGWRHNEVLAERDALREALERIAEWDDGGGSCQGDIARAALAKVAKR